MMYAIAFVIPPLALLFCGKPFSTMTNGIIWLVGLVFTLGGVGLALVIPCIIWAMAVVGGKRADKRTDRIIEALRE